MNKGLTILLLSFSLISCSDLLERPIKSSVVSANYYKTENDFETGLVGVYGTLKEDGPNSTIGGSYKQGLMYLGRVGTDEMFSNDNGEIFGGESQLNDYTYSPSNFTISRVWAVQYMGIQRANIIIDRLEKADIGNDAAKRRILGEARFLRAHFYFLLARFYGSVPIVTQEITDVSQVNPTRVPLEEVYDLIISDFKYAQENIPAGQENGKATAEAATAYLAKVYLQMAGWPLYDSSAADKCLNECKKLIDSGNFGLVDNYFSLFDGTNEFSKEYIWDISFLFNGTSYYGGHVGTHDGVVATYLYWHNIGAIPDMMWSYEDSDLRKENVAVYEYLSDTEGNFYYHEIVDEEGIWDDWNWSAMKFRHPMKKADRGDNWYPGNNGLNFPVLRYADLLLMYAEATARSTGAVDPVALEYVNMIRRRGYGVSQTTPNSSVDITASSAEDFLKKILWERKLELCFEGQRWFDLQRFDSIKEALESCTFHISGTENGHTPVRDYARHFNKEKHNFYPIPQDAIDASNGALKQSEAWL